MGGGVEIKHERVNLGEHTGIGPSKTPPLPGTLPILEHGDLTVYQSLGIETYICNLSPKFKALTPAQKAKDDMFANIKEDIQQVIPPFLFGDMAKKATIQSDLAPKMAKMYGICEGLCPANGFVNGLDFPTKADLAVLNMVKGFMPYGWGIREAFPDIQSKCPNMCRIAAAAAAADGVKEYLASDDVTLEVNPGM